VVSIGTTGSDCGAADAMCGLHVQGRDSYFNGDFAIVNGVVGIGYNTVNDA
jgi:hypothetical protein